MSKHILLYTDEPGLAGVGQYNHAILCALVALGYQVSCVQRQASNPMLNYQRELGIKHVWLEFGVLNETPRSLMNPYDPQKILSNARPDLIIFSDGWPIANFAAKQVAIQLGIPYVVVLGFVLPVGGFHPIFQTYLERLHYFYSQAKKVVAVSADNLGLLQKLFGLHEDKGQVIYYGRPKQYFTPPDLSVRQRLRQETNIPDDAVVCFTAARPELFKGYQYQLEAIQQLKQDSIWSQLYFAWVGSGRLDAWLKETVYQLGLADKVKVLGQLWDIPDWLDASDIFVLPSQAEGMPISIMEAMAKGLPVVASAVNGIPEELGDTGKLLPDPKIDPQATVTELIATLQEWSVNPVLRYSVGQAGKKRAEELFREERMVKETIELLEYVLSSEEQSENSEKVLSITAQELKLHVPTVAAVPEGIHRPFWSVMIPTYNCAHYLAHTLRSILAQDPGPEEIQIEVVDDRSTQDDPEAVVREIGQGRVAFIRQPLNVGAIANFNTCIHRARGHWVHILHGDDTVLPGFYSRLRAGLEQEPTVGAAFCRNIYMDENGNWHFLSAVERETPGILSDFLTHLSIANRIETPSIVVKRSVYEELGGFHLGLFHSADWDMWKRIAAHYPIWYEPQPSACYRMHSASDTSKLARSGANIMDVCRAIEIAESYLPSELAVEISTRAKEHHAHKAIDTAHRMFNQGERAAAIAQIRAGLKCSQSPRVMEVLVNLLQKVTSNSQEFNFLPLTALDQFLAEFQSLASLSQNVQTYLNDQTNQSVLANLRFSRKQVADKWLDAPINQLGDMYLGDLGKAHKMLIDSGIQREPLTNSELEFIDEIIEKLSQGFEQPRAMHYLLSAILYRPIHKLHLPSDHSQIPKWFLSDYLELTKEQKLLRESLKLRDFNFIVFPDWLQSEESLGSELVNLLKAIATHPNKSQITLLVDTSGISEEDANIMLSAVTMNLLLQEELDVSEGPEISLMGQLDETQWQALLPCIRGRIVLKKEDQQALTQAGVKDILTCEIDSFMQLNIVSV